MTREHLRQARPLEAVGAFSYDMSRGPVLHITIEILKYHLMVRKRLVRLSSTFACFGYRSTWPHSFSSSFELTVASPIRQNTSLRIGPASRALRFVESLLQDVVPTEGQLPASPARRRDVPGLLARPGMLLEGFQRYIGGFSVS